SSRAGSRRTSQSIGGMNVISAVILYAVAMRVLIAGTVYFAFAFAAGWVFGPIRELLVIPRVGRTVGYLFEAPLMLAVMVVAALGSCGGLPSSSSAREWHGRLEGLPQVLRVVPLLEHELPALVGLELPELRLVVLDQRQELRRQAGLEFGWRNGLDLGHLMSVSS